MLHRRHHLTAAALTSITIVGGILLGLALFFRPWETPGYAFRALLDHAAETPGYVVTTTGDLSLKGKTEVTAGTWRLALTAHTNENGSTDYDGVWTGVGSYRVGEVKSTFRGEIDTRILGKTLYVRLADYDLSEDLRSKWADYLALYRGVWYELPADALADLIRLDADTLTHYFATTGLLVPVQRTPTGDDIQITVGLPASKLEPLVHTFVHARGITIPELMTEKPSSENPTGGEVVWRVDSDGAPTRIDGRFSSATDALGGSTLSVTFTGQVTEKATAISTPDNVKAYDIRKIVF